MKKKTYLLMALAMVSMGMNAQNSEKSSLGNDAPEFVKTMKIGGTIRSKYEYQTEEGEGRFEVRTARINVAGNVTKEVSYKAEIDLCDEGKIKMLDAYTRIKPWKTLQFTIGICYEGGLSPSGCISDTRTPAQKEAMKLLILRLHHEFPTIKTILGHRDLPGMQKACPCFDATKLQPLLAS